MLPYVTVTVMAKITRHLLHVAVIVSCLCSLSAAVGVADYKFEPPYYLISVKAELYILPILPYELADLEPYIDAATMEAHYYGHHDGYRRRMNEVLKDWREDVSQLFYLLPYRGTD